LHLTTISPLFQTARDFGGARAAKGDYDKQELKREQQSDL